MPICVFYCRIGLSAQDVFHQGIILVNEHNVFMPRQCFGSLGEGDDSPTAIKKTLELGCTKWIIHHLGVSFL